MSVTHQSIETNSALIKAAFLTFRNNGQQLKIMVNRPTRYRGKDYSFFAGKRCVHVDETFVIKLSDNLKANGFTTLRWSVEQRFVDSQTDLYVCALEKKSSSNQRIKKQISALIASSRDKNCVGVKVR